MSHIISHSNIHSQNSKIYIENTIKQTYKNKDKQRPSIKHIMSND